MQHIKRSGRAATLREYLLVFDGRARRQRLSIMITACIDSSSRNGQCRSVHVASILHSVRTNALSVMTSSGRLATFSASPLRLCNSVPTLTATSTTPSNPCFNVRPMLSVLQMHLKVTDRVGWISLIHVSRAVIALDSRLPLLPHIVPAHRAVDAVLRKLVPELR